MMVSLRAVGLVCCALVVAGLAANTTICDGPSITIETNADASKIAQCGTYNGDVIVSTPATGSIHLDGLQEIAGDLVVANNSKLVGLTADSLTSIDGAFHLESLDSLSTLTFNNLGYAGWIAWYALGALKSFDFAAQLTAAVGVYIANTQLTTLDGISLTQVESIVIDTNPSINTINLDGLTNISEVAQFTSNGDSSAVSLASLLYITNLSMSDVNSINIPSLLKVSGVLESYSSSFENFSAPNLTTVGAALTLMDTSNMISLSFPSLTRIDGDVTVANNTNLTAVDGFDSLTNIGGYLDLEGSFTSVDFNSLRSVQGDTVVLTSSSNQSICDSFLSQAKTQVLKGSVKCQVNITDSSPSPNTGNDSNNSSGVHLPVGAKVGIAVGVIVIVVLSCWFCCINPVLKGRRSSRLRTQGLLGETSLDNLDSTTSYHDKLTTKPDTSKAQVVGVAEVKSSSSET